VREPSVKASGILDQFRTTWISVLYWPKAKWLFAYTSISVPLLLRPHLPIMLIAQSVTPFGIPRTGLVNLVPFTEIFSMVHAGFGLRKFAAATNKYLCSAPLHFFHTDNGAFVGVALERTFHQRSRMSATPKTKSFRGLARSR